MANDINGVPPNSLAGITDVSSNRRVSGDRPETGNSSESAPDRSGDTVALTDSARLLQRVETDLANAESVDVERVNAIKQSIASGTYKIDDAAVADKLLRSDAERSK